MLEPQVMVPPLVARGVREISILRGCVALSEHIAGSCAEMLDEFSPETSVGSKPEPPRVGSKPEPPRFELEDFPSESELARSASAVIFEGEPAKAASAVALIRSPTPQGWTTTRSPAWPRAKKLIAAAALGMAVGSAGALIVIDRDALRESQPPSSVTAEQSVGRPPAPVSADRVAATSLTIPKVPPASLRSQPAPTGAPELSAPTHPVGQLTRESAALPIPADVSTSEPAIPTLAFQGALADVLPAAAFPSAVVESPRPEPLVPESSLAPAVTATAERAVAIPPEIRSNNDQQAINEILSDYRAAYEARNAAAVKRVWPAANEGALVKAFANLESQDLALYGCRTSIEGATARASCDGQVSYVARRGSKNSRTQHRNWTFTLRRTSTDDWQIDGVQIE